MTLPWMHSAPSPFSDHIYKVAHGVQLDLRIFPGDEGAVSSHSPFVLYFHGGAYVAGNHYAPNAWVVPALRPRGIHVISIAYRFAPYVGLEEMVQDGLDAYSWLKGNLPSILGANKVSIDNYIVIGESAGGTIAALISHRLSFSSIGPNALVNIYGPTDFNDRTYEPKPGNKKPSPNDPSNQPLSGEFPEEDVRQAILSRDPSKALTVCPYQFDVPVELYRRLWATPDYEYTVEQRFQLDLKKYLRSHSGLPSTLLRFDECENESERMERRDQYSLPSLLEERGGYPPTAFLHGIDDKVVNVSQAERMAKKLKEMGIDVIELYEPGEGHEFDNKYTGPDVEGWKTYIEPIVSFLIKHTT